MDFTLADTGRPSGPGWSGLALLLWFVGFAALLVMR